MTFEREQEIRIEGKEIYVLSVVNYESEQYILGREIVDGELSDMHMAYKYDSQANAMVLIKDMKLLEILSDLFTKDIQTALEEE